MNKKYVDLVFICIHVVIMNTNKYIILAFVILFTISSLSCVATYIIENPVCDNTIDLIIYTGLHILIGFVIMLILYIGLLNYGHENTFLCYENIHKIFVIYMICSLIIGLSTLILNNDCLYESPYFYLTVSINLSLCFTILVSTNIIYLYREKIFYYRDL